MNGQLRLPRQQAVPVRWRMFGFLFAIGFLEYLQQRALTITAEPMMPALHLSQMQIGWLEQAFVIGYMLFQIPGGVFGQRWGARRMFLGIGTASVVCIAATAFAPDLFSGITVFAVMFAAQLLMGVAQAPTFPVSTGVFETWFPPARWPLVQGLQTMGLGFGGALAPPLIATLMAVLGWQKALLWTALPAIPLYLLWIWYARNSPREHAAVSTEELALLSDATSEQANARVTLRELGAILKDRHVMLLTLAYFCMNYLFYLLGNWCFLYLVQERHFSWLEGGWLATGPPVAAGIGAGIGGVIASYLYVRLGIRRGLRLTPLLAMPAAGLLMLLAVRSGSAYLAIALLAVCYGLVELTEGSFWAAAMTIGRRNTMAVGGVMNTGGSLGGVVGIPVVAYLSGHGHWNAAFLLGTAFAILTAVIWLCIDASHVAAEPAACEAPTAPGIA